jgi:hypothetical protein
MLERSSGDIAARTALRWVCRVIGSSMEKEHEAFFVLSRPRRAVVFVAPDSCKLDWSLRAKCFPNQSLVADAAADIHRLANKIGG